MRSLWIHNKSKGRANNVIMIIILLEKIGSREPIGKLEVCVICYNPFKTR